MIDRDRIEQAALSMLEAIGEDPRREGLVGTPGRIARMYSELFVGLDRDPAEELDTTFNEKHQEMVILKEIPFYSMCEHHFLPFFGMAHVGYIPNDRVVGISKIARAVEIIARRPQLQERLTTQIAEVIVKALHPQGVGVVIYAEHLCMTMRGIKKPGSKVITSAMRGTFRSEVSTRSEFLSLVRGR
ncbi:MAG: GTP cyclohydrolase I FolE [Dehalococcoidia bacterium]|nr:GTP cyclohydrolase I FolE [Dehalococcoidia bacterium]